MLEQRRAQEKGYITLKEAAEIANFSPDYVGQLIRAGKIKGEQVYSNLAWVTTEDEIRAYQQNKKRVVESTTATAEVLTHPAVTYSLYTIIAIIALVLLVLQYILYVSIDAQLSEWFVNSATTAPIGEIETTLVRN